MMYPGFQTDKNLYDRTPLMLWIIHRPGEDIPKELLYDDY